MVVVLGPLVFAWFVAVGLIAAPMVSAAQDFYFNSTETGCVAGAPTDGRKFCDDFEDGTWVGTGITGSSASVATKGWGNIVINSTPTAVCGGVGAGGTDCAAITRFNGSSGADNDAAHSFYPNSGGTDSTEYGELYLRFYLKPATGFTWADSKMLSLSQCCEQPGIFFGGLGIAFGSVGDNNVYFCPVEDCNFYNNGNGYDNPQCDGGICRSHAYLNYNTGASEFAPVNNHWNFIEIHVDLNTFPNVQNGIFRMWADDCGITGLDAACDSDLSSPTLRMSYTNIRFACTDTITSPPQGPCGSGNWTGQQIGTWFVDLWANSIGGTGNNGNLLIDQLVASTTGPIGFMGAEPMPPPPSPDQTPIHYRASSRGIFVTRLRGIIVVGLIVGSSLLAYRREAVAA